MQTRLLLLALLAPLHPRGDEFDWKRDRIVLANGREERGVVIEAFDPEHILVLRSAGSRDEIPRKEIQRIDLLRDRLAGFMRLRRPGLSMSAEWSLVEDAQRVGLAKMARLQAYHVLTLDAAHAGAHEFLDHRRSGDGWKWTVDEKRVGRERFEELSTTWDHRLILESEHFTLETDCGLRRALDILFDLEALYVWWMQHLGPELHPAEDVDEPDMERIVFEVHMDRESPTYNPQTSAREPYYTTSREDTAENGTFNVVRTFYTAEGYRPERLFELGTEPLVYSLLVLGKSRTRSFDPNLRRPSFWVERGLGDWVAQHCGGKPGYVQIRAPFQGDFVLESTLSRLTLAPLDRPHPLLEDGVEELGELVSLSDASLIGHSSNVPLARARVASFVAYLIEADPPIRSGGKVKGSGRAGLWHYLREVYGTGRASASDAFDDGLGGDVGQLEDPWKAWAKSFLDPRSFKK